MVAAPARSAPLLPASVRGCACGGVLTDACGWASLVLVLVPAAVAACRLVSFGAARLRAGRSDGSEPRVYGDLWWWRSCGLRLASGAVGVVPWSDCV